ncbi:MAG: flagellar hook-basal body protein [Oligoflexus sp.]
MLKNIYTPVAGALSHERAMEALANNLANINTVGFKGDNVTFTLLEPEPYKNYPTPIPPANFKVDLNKIGPLKGNEMSYVGIAGMERDFTQGPAVITHNKLDFMIEGQGFFQVQTNEGPRFTRAGDLTLSRDGALITKSGDPVLGEKGVIYLRSSQFEVNEKGEILQDGQLLDRLKLFEFEEPKSLERVGQNYYLYSGPEEDIQLSQTARVRQGFLEGSNVNSIKNLTSLIMAHRSYEAYQKAVSNFDQMMEKSSNSIGDVRA